MNITSRLLNLDKTLELHNEGEWNKTISDYSAFNDAGVECEVGEFLYSLVRILKPLHVLETGTHKGIGASYMGLALKDNNKGHLETIEFLPEIHKVALERFEKLGLDDIVTSWLMDAKDFIPAPETLYDLVLLDTEPQTRYAEFTRFYDFVRPGGFIFIHDLHRHMGQVENADHGFAWPFGPIPEFMKKVVRTREVCIFHFPTPRGLTGFYKSHEGDHIIWN